MSLLMKDPDALLDYTVDWGADYLAGDALASSNWSVSPDEPGGVAVAGSSFDFLVASVQVSGGEPGKLYRLSNRVVTASGRQDCRSIVLRVEKR